jgi:hypothetical protein
MPHLGDVAGGLGQALAGSLTAGKRRAADSRGGFSSGAGLQVRGAVVDNPAPCRRPPLSRFPVNR